jgi:hypothetical protein
MTPSFNHTYPIPGDMSADEWQRLTQDSAWQDAVDEAEQAAGGVLANGFQQRGWMKTWPELPTYSHYRQMQALIGRGFAAMLRDVCTGEAYEAASHCGKPLVFKRLFEPGDEVKARLLALVEGEMLGPPPELTPEQLAVLRSVLQEVLTSEDWAKIAQAAAQQVQQQVMDLRVA